MTHPCPVCLTPLVSTVENPDGRDAFAYNCPHCGQFALSKSLAESLPNYLLREPDASAKLSHFLRKGQSSEAKPILGTDSIDAILSRPLPRPREQADLLIRWLAVNAPGPGETVWIDYTQHGAEIGSKSPAGFELIVDHLIGTGLVVGNQLKLFGGGDGTEATLSFDGWDHYEQIKVGSAVYRKGFMAMKFGDVQLNKILEIAFKPGAKRAGFDLFKLDDIPKAGLIDNRMRVEIQSSDFLIADLTHDNLGAYWESGYAEGLGKPVIYTCERSKFEATKTHFDTNHHLTLLWDLDSPNAIAEALVATIRATLPGIARLTDSDV